MSGRNGSDAFGWGHQQAVTPQHGGQFLGDPSMMQQQASLHQQNRHIQTPSSSYREHPLPSPPASGYAASYPQARPPPSASPSMNYGMGPSMSGHHVQDSGGAPSSAYSTQPPYGSSAMSSGFQYGSPGFYGAPQPPQHPDTMAQQHQQYYGSHHPGSGAPTMDPNAQGHPMYGGSAAHMDPNVVGHSGQFHGGPGMLDDTGAYTGLQGVGIRPKRKQVKNACVNCQKACKKCDEGRPCGRCVKYGLADTCQDSSRKGRRRGIKRGPYKRRATTGSQPASSGAMAMPGGAAFYGRDGPFNTGSRSLDGVSSAPEETQLSSPGFGGQMVPPRPPLPMGMQSNVPASWQSTSSPSLRDVDDDRDARLGRNLAGGGGPLLGPNSYYGYEGQDGGPSPYDRSASAPIPGPGSLVLSPIGSLSQLQPTPGFSQGASGHQLPSLMSGPSSSSNLNGFYSNNNNGANRPLISPSLQSNPSAAFLNPALGTAAMSHNRLHSEGSFGGSLNSASTSASTMSPRTPMHAGQGGADYQIMSPPTNSSKFPTSYVPPQLTVPTCASTFLSQGSSRPFPLKMPKALQRNRTGTASSFLEAQASRSRMDYESSIHGDNDNNGGSRSSNGNNSSNLAPIRYEGSLAGQRSSPYLGGSGHHLHGAGDDAVSRRLGTGSSGLTPRIELSSYPTPMSMSSGGGGMSKREADVPGSLGLA